MGLTIYDIAQIFLTFQPMTHKKLQKLCYYAYAWYFTFYNERLCNAAFEAWIHGPVEPSLYRVYRDWGWQEIPIIESIPKTIDRDIAEFSRGIFDSYGELDGDQLEALTHSEPPWIEARKGLPPWEPSHEPLDDDAMRKFYLHVFEQGQSD